MSRRLVSGYWVIGFIVLGFVSLLVLRYNTGSSQVDSNRVSLPCPKPSFVVQAEPESRLTAEPESPLPAEPESPLPSRFVPQQPHSTPPNENDIRSTTTTLHVSQISTDPIDFGATPAELSCAATWGSKQIESTRASRKVICNPNSLDDISSQVIVYTQPGRSQVVLEFNNVIVNLQHLSTQPNQINTFGCQSTANPQITCFPSIVPFGTTQNTKINNVEERFVLFVFRDFVMNYFHSLMDHIMAFYTITTLQLTSKDVLIVFLDSRSNEQDSTFWLTLPLWSAISDYPPIKPSEYPTKGNILISHGAINGLGNCALGWATIDQLSQIKCPGESELIAGFVRHILSAPSINLISIPPPRKPTILFVSRGVSYSILIELQSLFFFPLSSYVFLRNKFDQIVNELVEQF